MEQDAAWQTGLPVLVFTVMLSSGTGPDLSAGLLVRGAEAGGVLEQDAAWQTGLPVLVFASEDEVISVLVDLNDGIAHRSDEDLQRLLDEGRG